MKPIDPALLKKNLQMLTKAERDKYLTPNEALVLYYRPDYTGTITVGTLLRHIDALEAQLAQKDERIWKLENLAKRVKRFHSEYSCHCDRPHFVCLYHEAQALLVSLAADAKEGERK